MLEQWAWADGRACNFYRARVVKAGIFAAALTAQLARALPQVEPVLATLSGAARTPRQPLLLPHTRRGPKCCRPLRSGRSGGGTVARILRRSGLSA